MTEARLRVDTENVRHKSQRKVKKEEERKKGISEREVRAAITRGGEILHKRCTYHVGVGSGLCVVPILNRRLFQLSFHRLGPVLRSLRHAQPPSLILAGFRRRSASSLHRPLSFFCFQL